jgi:hypothetical protein
VSDHPILFSGAMVRALLAGTKTQTRRMVKPQPTEPCACDLDDECTHTFVERGVVRAPARWGSHPVPCPYGVAGDRLWVRETWGPCDDLAIGHDLDDAENVAFQADLSACFFDGMQPLDTKDWNWDFVGTEQKRGWRPSIHMPRWASRITLEVTDVRVERLQDLSEGDAKAEGLGVITKDGGRMWKYGIPDRDGLPGNDDDGWHWCEWEADPRKAYAKLWNSITGPAAWDVNPWVWAVSFKRVSP